MIENIKHAESLVVADFKAHPVWEFLNDDEIGETMVRPVEKLPVETLDNRIVGFQVRLANDLEVWGSFGNFDVNPRATQHFLAVSIKRGGKWFYLARYHNVDFTSQGPEALAGFLGLGVDDVFPITVDVRRYVRGDPAILAAVAHGADRADHGRRRARHFCAAARHDSQTRPAIGDGSAAQCLDQCRSAGAGKPATT